MTSHAGSASRASAALSKLVLLTAAAAFACRTTPPNDDGTRVVEAGCGTCLFGLTGDDCALAIRLDGQALFVDGSDLDAHGDAHAPDGFCNQIGKARVRGEVIGGRFVATEFDRIERPRVSP